MLHRLRVEKIKENQKYKDVLGLNVRALQDTLHSIHKMAWEQVLLLAIYSRQRYIECSDDRGFNNRIQLVHEARKDHKLMGEVLNSLEQGKGSNDIVAMLLNDGSLSSTTLLADIESKQIAFTTYSGSHPFSYFAMYTMLHDPLSVFQQLLAFDGFSLTEFIVHRWQGLNKSPFPMSNNDEPLFNPALSLDRLTDIIEEKGIEVNREAFASELKGALAQIIGKHLKATFDLLHWRSHAKYEPASLFSEMCTVEKNKHHFRMDFDAVLLSNMINLGQVDSLMEGIKAEITRAYDKSPLTGPFGSTDNKSADGVIDALSEWYKSVNTGLIKKIERVPALIACLLDFDLRFRIGMGSEGFGLIRMSALRFKLTSRDYAMLVTAIIRYTLFKSGSAYDFNNNVFRTYQSIESFLADFAQKSDNDSAGPALVKTWSNLEQGPMIERFKKLPGYLKPHLNPEMIREKIAEQKRLSREESTPYPINSLFPLPLWAKLSETATIAGE